MRILIKLLGFGLIICSLLICYSCRSFGDPVIKIKGVVRDEQSKPVENATVQLEYQRDGETRKFDLDQSTKNNGEFEFSAIGSIPETLKIIVSKNNYKVFKERVLPDEVNHLDITLKSSSD